MAPTVEHTVIPGSPIAVSVHQAAVGVTSECRNVWASALAFGLEGILTSSNWEKYPRVAIEVPLGAQPMRLWACVYSENIAANTFEKG